MQSMSNLSRLSKYDQARNGEWAKFQEFMSASMADGAIPAKYKELIALGVALTTQCGYCLELHKQAALKAGVTEEEIVEVTMVAANLRAGAALTHGTQLLSD